MEQGQRKRSFAVDGWFKTSIFFTLIFLAGVGVGREMPRLFPKDSFDYSFESERWRITWKFKKQRPIQSQNKELEALVMKLFASNFAVATLVSQDSTISREMLMRLGAFLSVAFRANLPIADSVIRADSLAEVERRSPNKDSVIIRSAND